MNDLVATIHLPNELNKAIMQAVNDALKSAKQQMASDSDYPMYMNMKQAASYLGVSHTTLKKWIKMYPNFPVKTIDGSYHINREKLDEFMTNK